MKKRIIVCATVIVIISALISGCESKETRSNKMFECVDIIMKSMQKLCMILKQKLCMHFRVTAI